MVFHWSLSDSKSPQVSRTLLSILAVLNNIVVWMVSTRPPTSKSSSTLSNPLVTVPNAPIIISIFVTCILLLLFAPWEFLTLELADGLLLKFESQQNLEVSRTLIILVGLNNAFVLMVSTWPLICKSPSHNIYPLLAVLNVPITIGITLIIMFHCFFISIWRSMYLSFFLRFLSVLAYCQPQRQSPIFGRFSFFTLVSVGLLVWPRFDDLFDS